MSFVTLTKKQFEENCLPKGWRIVDDPVAKEIIYEFPTEVKNLTVRVFSTVDKRDNLTRDIGTDAIRIVFWANNRPIGKGKRIHRTEGKTTIGERIQSRITEFLSDAKSQNIIDFGYVRAILEHDAVGWNSFAQSLLEQLDERGSLTDGQLKYVLGIISPKGKPTLEATVKDKDPEFEYVEYEEDEDVELKAPVHIQEKPKKQLIIEDVPCWGEVDNPAGIEDDEKPAVGLIPTSEFKEYPYPFPSFNPVQSMVFPIRNDDINVVLGSNTSSGKTIAAELMMQEVLDSGKRVLFMSPLKALTEEKYHDWSKRFPEYNITILTGDYVLSDKNKEALSKAKILTLTSEMVDSRSRRYETEKNFWIKEVGMVIVDEAHILTTSRGHAVETGLMRFSKINPNARIVFLSATMPNCQELARWLTILNGKSSKVIFSNWRPVQLQFQYYEYSVTGYYNSDQQSKIDLAIRAIMDKPSEKYLVFVHDKGTGRKIIQKLKYLNEEALFHNADLALSERRELEENFKSREEGSLRVMVSTPTCAWGVNLPARNVVIVGMHRGMEEVDTIDIIQECGRAGRPGWDDAGFVHMVIPEGKKPFWEHTFANPRPVRSILKDHRILAFHILAEIDTRQITSSNDAKAWYKRSLASLQNQDFTDNDIEALLEDLEKMQMIVRKGPWINITGLGKVSAWLYYSPYSVYSWYTNLQRSFEIGMDDLLLAYSIADIPENNWNYIPKECKEEVATFDWQLRNRGIIPSMASPFSVAAYKCLTGDTENKSFAVQTRAIKYDIRRMVQAISLIDSMWAKWDKKELWSILPARIMYGVSEEVVFLTKLSGIGGKRAMKLWDSGFRTFSDIADPGNRGRLMKMFSPKIVLTITKEAAQYAVREDVA